jgi:hypothetical protein
LDYFRGWKSDPFGSIKIERKCVMKRRGFLLLLAALWFLPGICMAAEVTEAVITTGISERRPVDAGETFPASVGRLYCFTELTGAADGKITHVWYREGQEMARIELPVSSSHWRTWSSKTLLPEWTGKWEVQILDGSGNLLKIIPFTLS